MVLHTNVDQTREFIIMTGELWTMWIRLSWYYNRV